MDDDWEQLAEKENVVVPPPKVPNVNKWEGEDEDDEVKDSWEDEEEKKDEEKVETKTKSKPKRTLQEKISEKERLRIENEERLAEERRKNMTPEERLEEKLRLQKIQEEEDLKAAMETFGVKETLSIDAMNPTSKEEFMEFAQAIGAKLVNYKNSDEFPGFVEELVRNVCANLCSADIRKIKVTVDTVHLEKQKIEKEKKKPASKGKTKIKLRVEGDTIKSNNIGDYEFDDYDDFM